MKTIIFGTFATVLASSAAYAQVNEDLTMVVDGKKFSIAYYKSSVKSLPPDWKKVWVITNRKKESDAAPERVQSIRRNILFNCVRNTYSTLAVVNYAELNAMGKPTLQTDSGFDLNDDPVPEGTPLAIIQSQVCGS